MHALQSGDLFVRVDPRHGGEVLDLVDLASGRQLLGRTPFGTTEPRSGDLELDDFISGYRGGWQFLIPNAGAACDLGGVRHGFHGRATNDPWEVGDRDSSQIVLNWRGRGLDVERRLAIEDGALVVRTRASAEVRTPFVAVEHVTAGIELLDPEIVLDLPGGRAARAEVLVDGAPGPDAPTWPRVAGPAGVENRTRARLESDEETVVVVADLPEGWAVLRNEARDLGLAIAWEREAYPNLWLWREMRTFDGIWRKSAEIMGIEPASVPHANGLAEAVDRGQATWLAPGDEWRATIALRPLRDGRTVTASVDPLGRVAGGASAG